MPEMDDEAMYLVHAHLTAALGAAVPDDAAALITGCAGAGEAVEHVVVHRVADSNLVVGVFLLAPSLRAAEGVAEAVCRRALATYERLGGLTFDGCQVPFVAAYYERAADPAAAGQLMPRHDPSTDNPFHPFC
ncbi:hypothetical protein [Streptomyces buecherae]|uniref:Uncharacterized protein n=1 Tax=Streptomyces buecherae TaxID=2763006 RepID=A0A7H8NF13_9ACTN|nr:hypothetical protein [Streptomyces buecherae]QKW53055.1 hypothetical protein HUT08_29875 [Streptomyces buecherae]